MEKIVEKLVVALQNVPTKEIDEEMDEVMALAKSRISNKTRKDSLVVDYSTPIREQCEELGVTCCLDEEKVKDLFPPAKDGRLYLVENGEATLFKTVAQYMRERRRGLTIKEGLALVRADPEPLPELLRHHHIDLVGSRYGCLWTSDAWEPSYLLTDTGRVPRLSLYDDCYPELISCNPIGSIYIKEGAPSCAIRKGD